MIIKGFGGRLELLDDCVIIRRTLVLGLLFQKGLKGDKRIPYSSIVALQCKRPGFTNGYIQFTLAGGIESTAGVLASASDENSLQFIDPEQFDKAQEYIEKRMGALARTIHPDPTPTSPVDQIEKLATLLDRGLLTQAEFDAQKQILLAPLMALENADERKDEVRVEAFQRMQAAMDQAIAEQQGTSPARPVRSNNATPSFGKRQGGSLLR